jgi:hypothetical protein
MKEEWLMSGAVVPVDVETTAALVAEIRRLIDVVGGMALAQPEQVTHTVIAGALFDFMGYLTSRRERIVLSASDDAAPAVDAIRDFAKKRGLSLDDAQVREWIDALAQTEQKINHAETERIHPFKLAKGEKGVITYSGNGSAERREINAPTGFFFQVDKRLEEDDDIQDYKKPWVGLTEDEVIDVFKEKNAIKFARAIEAKLKELNT